MTTILFATGNERKFAEAAAALAAVSPEWRLERLAIDIPEIQTDDPIELLTAKARHVRAQTARPFLIDDVSSVLDGTVNFPGALSKQVLRGLGTAALPRVFAAGQKITVTCTLALAYLDETHFFSGAVTGTIRHGERPLGQMPLNGIVWLDDQGMFLGDEGAVTHRAKALAALRAFLDERAAHAEQEQDATSARWTERAPDWSGLTRDASSYVNHENGYARFDRVLASVMKSAAAPTCLDVGCGTGIVARNMLAAGAAAVLGIDASPGMIEAATASSPPDDRLAFRCVQAPNLPPDAAYDVIASRGTVISHLPKWRAVSHLEALTRLTRAGSVLVMDVISDLGNGGFPNAGRKNVLSFDALAGLMRELGWVPVARDGDDSARVVIAAFHRPHPDSRYFVTGNSQKLLELRAAADLPHLHGCDFDLPELKDDDIARIAEHKARQAFALVGRPVISTDGGIFLDALGGFPGANSKQAAVKLGPDGLLKLLDGAVARSGCRRNVVALFDGESLRTHVSEVPIDVAAAARGSHPAYPLDRILVPVDERNAAGLTYAEMPVAERAAFTELPALAAFIRNPV
jgi:XTP/dITP diphosphohydrolase